MMKEDKRIRINKRMMAWSNGEHVNVVPSVWKEVDDYGKTRKAAESTAPTAATSPTSVAGLASKQKEASGPTLAGPDAFLLYVCAGN